MNNNSNLDIFSGINTPAELFFGKIDKFINPKKYSQIVKHREYSCNNSKEILYKINQKVSKIFENQKFAHKDVFELMNEVEN